MNKVLICDDEPLLRQLMRVALVGDYTFEEAATVEESIERAGSFRPDVALVDVMMPGGSGLEIIRYLKGDTELQPRPLRRRSRRSRARPTARRRSRQAPRHSSPSRSTPTSSHRRWRSCSRAPGESVIRRAGGWLAARYQRAADNAATAPIVARVVGAIGVLALLVAAAFAFVLVALSNLRGSTNEQAVANRVTTAALRLERVVDELDQSLRGFVLTRNAAIREELGARAP